MKKITGIALSFFLILGCAGCFKRDNASSSQAQPLPLPIPGEDSSSSEPPPGLLPSVDEEDGPDVVSPDESTIDPLEEAARLRADTTVSEAPLPELSPKPDTDAAGASALETRTADPSAADGPSFFTAPDTQPPRTESGIAQTADLDPADFEMELLRLINEERENLGIPALVMDDKSRVAARVRAPEILEQLSHTRPNGDPYYTAFDEAGYTYAGKWHGENVGYMYFGAGLYDTLGAAQKMFGALKESSGHYQNMLSENFLFAGIGVHVQTEGDIVKVGSAQLFSSL